MNLTLDYTIENRIRSISDIRYNDVNNFIGLIYLDLDKYSSFFQSKINANNKEKLEKELVHYRLYPNENENPDTYYFSFFDYPLEVQAGDITTNDFIRRTVVSKYGCPYSDVNWDYKRIW